VCVLSGGEALISVLILFQQSLLPYEVEHCHYAKQLHQHSSKFIMNSRFQLFFKHSTKLCTNDCLSMILLLTEDGPIKSQKSVNITLLAEGTLLDFSDLGDNVFPLHALTFACKFIAVPPCFITCDNPLHKSFCFFMT